MLSSNDSYLPPASTQLKLASYIHLLFKRLCTTAGASAEATAHNCSTDRPIASHILEPLDKEKILNICTLPLIDRLKHTPQVCTRGWICPEWE